MSEPRRRWDRMLWIVCGAGKGVGKTRVARGLVRVLPGARYAKHGHGAPSPHKPGPLLQELHQVRAFLAETEAPHVVVESNELALRGEGDRIVFVDGLVRQRGVRPDAGRLREQAHLVVDREAVAGDWYAALARTDLSPERCREVVRILSDQQRFFRRQLPRPRVRTWFDLGEGHGFGSGLAHLLREVQRTGTLKEAADSVGMSYRYAWKRVRTAEQGLGAPLVETRPGGRGGGRSRLAPAGIRMLACFEELERRLQQVAEEEIRRIAEEHSQEGELPAPGRP